MTYIFYLCIVQLYVRVEDMIKSFRHKGLEQFYETGSTAGIQAKHANKLNIQLSALDQATHPQQMNIAGWNLHPLKGKLENHWAVKVNGNWRMTFTFDGENAELVDYQDYH